jgi:cysteine desulfurase
MFWLVRRKEDVLIYMDYAASTPVDPRVIERMTSAMETHFANPSSRHGLGYSSARAVQEARKNIAESIGAHPNEVIFTSGATEAINLVMRGLFVDTQNAHLIVSATEHKAVLGTAAALETSNAANVTRIAPGSQGFITPEMLEEALREDTRLVAIMWSNNETGVQSPIEELAAICRERGVLFLTDATQAVGNTRLDLTRLGIDFLAMSGHKICVPKGIGMLFARRALQDQIHPVLTGGGHERGLRSGTLNVPGILALEEGFAILNRERDKEVVRIRALRDSLESKLRHALPTVEINGNVAKRAPHISNVFLPGVDNQPFLARVRQKLCLSAGSACNSTRHEASHVLLAMGYSEAHANSSIRLSLGRYTTSNEIEQAVRIIEETVTFLRYNDL